jgi:hypothetical protein
MIREKNREIKVYKINVFKIFFDESLLLNQMNPINDFKNKYNKVKYNKEFIENSEKNLKIILIKLFSLIFGRKKLIKNPIIIANNILIQIFIYTSLFSN